MVWIYELHLFLDFKEITDMLSEENNDDEIDRLQLKELNEVC